MHFGPEAWVENEEDVDAVFAPRRLAGRRGRRRKKERPNEKE